MNNKRKMKKKKKENTIYIHHGILLCYKEECTYVMCRKMDGTGDQFAERDKPSSKDQILQVLSHLWNLDKK
jgi:hypothetical protein